MSGKQVAQPKVDREKPKNLHCLVCHTPQPVSDIHLVENQVVTKTGKQMTRCSWKGTCDVCHKKVNQFAKSS